MKKSEIEQLLKELRYLRNEADMLSKDLQKPDEHRAKYGGYRDAYDFCIFRLEGLL